MAGAYTPRSLRDYKLVFQDTGDPLTRVHGPIAIEQLKELAVGPLTGYPVDAYMHCVNHAGGVYHRSKVRERVTAGLSRFPSASALQMHEAINHLDTLGTDPLHVYAEAAHERAMDYVLNLRMNDLHDRVGYRGRILRPARLPKVRSPEPYYLPSAWKEAHAQYLLGDPHELLGEESERYWEASATNYALGPVRQYHLDLAAELVQTYDLEGLQLGFIRHPIFFRRTEAYAQRHVMTDVVRRIRQLTREASARRGRPIWLSAQLPDSIELALRVGLDVQTWLREGLLDLLIVGGGYAPFGTPWREMAGLGAAAGVPALATLNSVHSLGVEAVCAAAARALEHGVQGFLLWNFFYEYPHYQEAGVNKTGLDFTRALVDRTRLAQLPKAYHLDAGIGHDSWIRPSQEHAAWPPQVPLTVGEALDGRGNTVTFEVAEEGAQREGHAELVLSCNDVGPGDRLTFQWNGEAVAATGIVRSGVPAFDRETFHLRLPLASVRRGENTLEIVLENRDARLDPFVTLLTGVLRIPGLG